MGHQFHINAKDYGVKLDGATNDGDKLRELIALVGAQGGGEIYLPYGTALVDKDEANPWCLNIADDNIQISGEGTIKHSGSAGSDPCALIAVTGGAMAFTLDGVTLDQSGLTDPDPGNCPLLNIEEATGTKILGVHFKGGVAGAGPYVQLGGVADKECYVTWFDQACRFVECGSTPFVVGSNTSVLFLIGGTYFEQTGQDDTILLDDTLDTFISDVTINDIRVEDGIDKYAIRAETSSGTLERILVDHNYFGGFAKFSGGYHLQVLENDFIAAAGGVTEPVLEFADCLASQFNGNHLVREATCADGLLWRADTVEMCQFKRQTIRQQTSAGIGYVYDCIESQFSPNMMTADDAGSTEHDAITIEAENVAADYLQFVGDQLTATAGTWATAYKVTPNGALIKNVQINPGTVTDCDGGVLFEGVAADYSGFLMVAGAVIDADSYAYDMPTDVFIRIGGNASTFGPQMIAGRGAPGGKVVARRGSTYHRIDGGAGSTYYIKESDTTHADWRAL